MKKLIGATLLALLALMPLCGQWVKNGEKEADTPDHKSVNGFGAHLLVVKKPLEFIEEWKKPETPHITPVSVAKRGEQLGIFILFAGCKPDANGKCNSEVDYSVYKPDGTTYTEKTGLELWKDQAPPAPNIQLSRAILALRMERADPDGEYKVKAKVHDLNADISFELETKFRL